MLNLCLTFDHEIFFGNNFCSEEEILFQPTYKIMQVLCDNDVSGTFFTDVCSVFKYESLGLYDYPTRMAEQLKSLFLNKQDIQLHIHSHWYKTIRTETAWNFDKESYRIHTFGFDESDSISAGKIIKDGKKYLEKLLREVDESYQCIAFRAGGFCVQPEGKLLRILNQNGIVIDSSIAKNLSAKTEIHSYSFKGLPSELNWWINPEKGIAVSAPPNKRNMFEVPIGTLNKKPLKWYLSRANQPFSDSIKGTYLSFDFKKKSKAERYINWLASLWSTPLTLSLDNFRSDILIRMVQEYIKDYDCEKNEYYVSVLCHPKLMGNDRIINMHSFIQSIKKKIPVVKFTTMRDIYNLIRQ